MANARKTSLPRLSAGYLKFREQALTRDQATMGKPWLRQHRRHLLSHCYYLPHRANALYALEDQVLTAQSYK